MEENNDIFLAGGDALVYLAEPLHKKYSTKFVWGHPFSTYVSYNRQFTFWMTSPFPTYKQKINNKIRILYSLKHKHSEKKIFKSHTHPKILYLILVMISHWWHYYSTLL